MQAENSPISCPENFVKDVEYILVCGIIWKKTADLVVGWELIRGLNSHDQYLREIANGILVECGQPSMELLENGRKTLRYRLLRRNLFSGDRTPVEVRRLLWKKQGLKTI